MKKSSSDLARMAANLGMTMCLAAGLLRYFGYRYVFGYEPLSFFMGGMGLLIIACWLRLDHPSGS